MFSDLLLNNAGQLIFKGYLEGTNAGSADDEGVFLTDGIGPVVQMIRAGQPDPDGEGTIGHDLLNISTNDMGQVVFKCDDAPLWGENSIFVADGVNTPIAIRRPGQPAPDGNGHFVGQNDAYIQINNDGQVFFLGVLEGTNEGTGDDRGLYLGDGVTPLLQIVREGQAAPDGNGSFSTIGGSTSLTHQILNDSGQVVFRGLLDSTSGGDVDNGGIFLGDGKSPLTQIIRAGDPVIGGDVRLGNGDGLRVIGINNSGQVAFNGVLTGPTVTTSNNYAVFLLDGNSTPSLIARKGDLAPDGNGYITRFYFTRFNDNGQFIYEALFDGTSGGASDERGLIFNDGINPPTFIARRGQAAPNGDGVFLYAYAAVINNLGQVAFRADFTGTSGGYETSEGLYFYDQQIGLIKVVRFGDSMLGSTVVDFDFAVSYFNDEQTGLNDLGQVAYSFLLEDGRSGLAIWSVPEPSSLIVLIAGVPFIWKRSAA